MFEQQQMTAFCGTSELFLDTAVMPPPHMPIFISASWKNLVEESDILYLKERGASSKNVPH